MPALAEKGNAGFLFRDLTPEEQERNKKETTMNFMLDNYFAKSVSSARFSAPAQPPRVIGDHFRILSAATGSGKGSIPFELYNRYWSANHKTIACLEPTITTAISIPMEIISNVPQYKDVFKLGKNVGYQTGHFVRKPISGVLFMTIGVLVQMMRVMTDEQFMNRFSFILLDEAHMRKLDVDMVLAMLKQLVRRNVTNLACPMIMAMSGTLDSEKYARYLEIDKMGIINVETFLYPKEEHYAPQDVSNYIEETVTAILRIHRETGKDDKPEAGDIIVFIRSAEPGREISKRIEKENESMTNKILITTIDANAFRLGTSEYFAVLRPLEHSPITDRAGKKHVPTRRLILGTPAMEAGLTIPSAKYCIETGYEWAVLYNPIYDCTVEGPKPIAQSMARQRIGRIGRKFPGVFYTMYTRATFDKMEKDQDPDIWTRDVAPMLLNMAVAQCMPSSWDRSLNTFSKIADARSPFNPIELDIMDSPSADSMSSALEKLFIMGFLNAQMHPTLMGCAAVRFPRSPLENMRMIFEGYMRGANIEDLICIAAILEAGPSMLINTNPMKGERFKPFSVFGESDAREKQKYVGCDLIELLFAFYAIRAKINEMAAEKKPPAWLREWMIKNGLVWDQWLAMIGLRDQLIMLAVANGLNPYENGLGIAQHKYSLVKLLKEDKASGAIEVRKLKECIFEGYRLCTATWSVEHKRYVHDYSGAPLEIKSIAQAHVAAREVTAARPRKIIVFGMAARLPQKSADGLYTFTNDAVSVVDGLIDIDETFAVS